MARNFGSASTRCAALRCHTSPVSQPHTRSLSRPIRRASGLAPQDHGQDDDRHRVEHAHRERRPPNPGRPPPWRKTAIIDSPSSRYLVICDQVPVTTTSEVMSESGKTPGAEHREVEPGGDRAALGHGVGQRRRRGVGDGGLADPQAGQGDRDRRPVRREVQHPEGGEEGELGRCDRGEGGLCRLRACQVLQQVVDDEDDDAVGEEAGDDAPADAPGRSFGSPASSGGWVSLPGAGRALRPRPLQSLPRPGPGPTGRSQSPSHQIRARPRDHATAPPDPVVRYFLALGVRPGTTEASRMPSRAPTAAATASGTQVIAMIP